ncbi:MULTISPECIES: MetQ/NlpA family ABC transporter substrate-binding protein [Bacillaceae]|uniref:Lipoprotein n=1 Tax=Bacillus infantis NRRL B-14911 TaxID=1367477 RepID=U5LF33_9BACI|nr:MULTISPECIES: MetQ/NlpA family ABC transporter substrate-binding protein [Bacillus]OXT14969.1 methionine ABC transporter substrate-binding protein [Bacillus sp. OG2]AGX06075.1 methionine ABC transporter substrate-binding protein [Bacillus infantis NRRL B-14911]EAR63761.1 amino acid ABC transporter (substrate binding protein) (lipoprotein) [Bacillus sp. NRRL B-14911]MCA1033881.1 MetQ/NlpA family ABC transporter substrate-binding protein [Bacillus infantis]MCK6207658.1 MetQ/NlpA family ABC tr
MKKWLSLVLALAVALVISACGTSEDNADGGNADSGKEETSKLVVGASNVPHAEILEEAKPLLEEKGIELEVVTFQDYILPNQALNSGELDANYFQHIPYLEAQIEENDYDFVNAGGIHIEPIGVYSKKYKSLDELPDGAKVLMSNSVADHGRILTMLEKEGLITLKEGVDKIKATIDDIETNEKNLEFDTEYEASLLPQIYNNDEGDAVLINSNYAIDAGLNPIEDSIAIEDKESPYVNVIAVKSGDEDKEAVKALVEVLHSKEIQDFILEKYEGAVVPVSE